MRRSVFAIAAVVALLLSGCAAESAPPSASQPASPTPTASATPEKDIVAEALKALGPVPVGLALTPAQEESARLAEVERSWAALSTQFPDAKRPAVTFVRYTEDTKLFPEMRGCLEDLNVHVDLSRNGKGEVNGYSVGAAPGDEVRVAVAGWSCSAKFPLRPMAPPTKEQLGYTYDYLTQFQVPCFEAHGSPQSPPPSRDVFINEWPNQNWWPTFQSSDGRLDYDVVDAACPMMPIR